MSAYKRGDRWHYRFCVGGKDVSGSVGPTGTKADAVAIEAKIRAEILSGKLGKAPPRTIDDAIARWLQGEASLLRSYHTVLSQTRAVMPYTNGLLLPQIVDAAHGLKASSIQSGLAVSTINRRLALLRRVANLAHEWGWLNDPVGRRIKLLPGETKRHIYLTRDQVELLAECCPHATVALAIRLAARTGLRENELIHVDTVHDGCIVIPPELSKTGRPRLVPVPADMDPLSLPLGITYNTLRRHFEAARSKAGMPHVHIHDLRHTAASWWAQSGATLAMLRDLLGHTSFAETSRYTHLCTADLKRGSADMTKKTTADEIRRHPESS
jgi:integrase